MSCPFYAHALHRLKPGFGGDWTLHPNPRSNQCALITSAHSPCIMEVDIGTAPDWQTCPRNPENSEPPRD